jgi:GTP pyrophosphokinase
MSNEDSKNIRRAYEIALEAHSKQRRKSGEPYILHPIEVARICAREIGLGPTAIVSALLHDVVEDTDLTIDEIYKEFGQRVGMIVDGLTKLDSAYNAQNPQAENFKKVLSTMLVDVRVVLIKIADRLHNLRTIGSMPMHKQLRTASETTYIYSPLAHRLGLYAMKTELQDLCMKVTDNQTYKEIAQKLQETKKERDKYISEFIKPLKKVLNALKIPYEIYGRPKSIYSIWNKLRTKKIPFEEIYDLFAVRIIIDVPIREEKSACWQVYSVVTDVHTPIPERLKDWVTTPKSNGYESLHTTVIGPKGKYVEVQIRSSRMDDIAERGFAAHWKYKGAMGQPDVYDKWLNSVREIIENHDAEASEFLLDFKTNLFNEEVYVYTPKGDMKILPKGATALDFAFSIHSDVGYHCKAVKINNKLVPMGYKLQNGDQLTVITASTQKPTETWLKMVVTGKAKSKIRSALKEERKYKGDIGKEAILRKFKKLKLDFESNIEILVKHFGFVTRLDLYVALYNETVSLSVLKNFEIRDGILIPPRPEGMPKQKTANIKRPRTKKDVKTGSILINGEPASTYNFSLAACCKPVPGDDIFAYVSSSSNMKIHRFNCPNAAHMMAKYGYRIQRAEWDDETNSTFIAELILTGIDEGPGVIEKVTHEISSLLGLNIRSFYIDGDEGYFEGKIRLHVQNIDQLNRAIFNLRKLSGISSVYRVE